MGNAVGENFEVYASKNEADALALASENPGAMCFTPDKKSIVFNGEVYGGGTVPVAVSIMRKTLLVNLFRPLQEGEEISLFRRTRAKRDNTRREENDSFICYHHVHKYTLMEAGAFSDRPDSSYRNYDPMWERKRVYFNLLRFEGLGPESITGPRTYVLCDGEGARENPADLEDLITCFLAPGDKDGEYTLQDGRHCVLSKEAGRRKVTLHMAVGIVRYTENGYELRSNLARFKIKKWYTAEGDLACSGVAE